jgi:hypothetical protein
VFFVAACFVQAGDPVDQAWKKGPPGYKTTKAELDPDVEITKEKVTLTNRGIAISKEEFSKGFELSLVWTWKKGADKQSYQDVLTIGIRTDGKQRKYPSELEDGVIVRFAGHAKTLAVEVRKKGQVSSDPIAHIPIECERNTPYPIKILEKPGQVVIYYKDLTKPALTVTIPVPAGKNVTLDNRESGAGNAQVSVIEKLTIKSR